MGEELKKKNDLKQQKEKSNRLLKMGNNYTYVHTKLSYQVPYFKSLTGATPITPSFETHENQEIQNMGVLIIGILIVGAAVKAIKTFGKIFQNTNAKENTKTAKQH